MISITNCYCHIRFTYLLTYLQPPVLKSLRAAFKMHFSPIYKMPESFCKPHLHLSASYSYHPAHVSSSLSYSPLSLLFITQHSKRIFSQVTITADSPVYNFVDFQTLSRSSPFYQFIYLSSYTAASVFLTNLFTYFCFSCFHQIFSVVLS